MPPPNTAAAGPGSSQPGCLAPIAALVVAMISIQCGASLAKGLFPLVGAEGATALRLVVGGAILTVVLRPWRVRVTRRGLPALLGYGVSIAAMNLAFYMSLRTIPLGVAVALEFTGPLAVATLTSRRMVDFVWVGLALVGLLLLSPFVHAGPRIDPGGVALALVAGAFWALYIVLAQRAGGDFGSAATALGTLIAAAVVLPIGLAHAGAALWAPSVLGGAVLVGVFSSALPFSLEMVALTRLPTRLYGTLTSLEPVLGALTGLLWLHERLQPAPAIGIVVVMAAAAGAVWTGRRPKAIGLG